MQFALLECLVGGLLLMFCLQRKVQIQLNVADTSTTKLPVFTDIA